MIDQGRDTIMATSGKEVDITEQMDKIFNICDRDDYLDPYYTKFLRKFGLQLILVAGPDAPLELIDDYEDEMSADFAAFLREIWSALIAEWK
jgi:hypothetical protein